MRGDQGHGRRAWHDEAYAADILEEPEVWGVELFGPNEVVIRMVLKVQPARQWAVNRELRRRLKLRLRARGHRDPLPAAHGLGRAQASYPRPSPRQEPPPQA